MKKAKQEGKGEGQSKDWSEVGVPLNVPYAHRFPLLRQLRGGSGFKSKTKDDAVAQTWIDGCKGQTGRRGCLGPGAGIIFIANPSLHHRDDYPSKLLLHEYAHLETGYPEAAFAPSSTSKEGDAFDREHTPEWAARYQELLREWAYDDDVPQAAHEYDYDADPIIAGWKEEDLDDEGVVLVPVMDMSVPPPERRRAVNVQRPVALGDPASRQGRRFVPDKVSPDKGTRSIFLNRPAENASARTPVVRRPRPASLSGRRPKAAVLL